MIDAFGGGEVREDWVWEREFLRRDCEDGVEIARSVEREIESTVEDDRVDLLPDFRHICNRSIRLQDLSGLFACFDESVLADEQHEVRIALEIRSFVDREEEAEHAPDTSLESFHDGSLVLLEIALDCSREFRE